MFGLEGLLLLARPSFADSVAGTSRHKGVGAMKIVEARARTARHGACRSAKQRSAQRCGAQRCGAGKNVGVYVCGVMAPWLLSACLGAEQRFGEQPPDEARSVESEPLAFPATAASVAADADDPDAPLPLARSSREVESRAELSERHPTFAIELTASEFRAQLTSADEDIRAVALTIIGPDGSERVTRHQPDEVIAVDARGPDGELSDGLYKFRLSPYGVLVSGAFRGGLPHAITSKGPTERYQLSRAGAVDGMSLDADGRVRAAEGAHKSVLRATTGSFRVFEGSIITPLSELASEGSISRSVEEQTR